MKKFIKFLLTFLLIIVLLILGVATYFGVVPVLSGAMGFNKPKDLDVVYTEKNYTEGLKKTGVIHKSLSANEIKTGKTLVREGKTQIETSFTSEEVTAAANNVKWVHFPFKDIQIKFNDDGTGEASGVLKSNEIYGYLQNFGVPESAINKAREMFKIPMVDLPFYVHTGGSVTNNKVNLEVKSLEIAKIAVPSDIITQYTPAVESVIENYYDNDPSVYIEKLEFSESKVNFKGTMPKIESSLDK